MWERGGGEAPTSQLYSFPFPFPLPSLPSERDELGRRIQSKIIFKRSCQTVQTDFEKKKNSSSFLNSFFVKNLFHLVNGGNMNKEAYPRPLAFTVRVDVLLERRTPESTT